MTEGVAVGTLGAFRGCWIMEVIHSPIMHMHGTRLVRELTTEAQMSPWGTGAP